jgi:hypothetical protein
MTLASVYKIVALGQTDAEEAALLWASDNGILTERSCLLPNANLSFSRTRHMGWLLENVVQSDAGEPIKSFARSVFEVLLISTHV